MATPLVIEIGLHYHCRPDDFRGGDFSAPAVRAAIDAFVEAGMLALQPGVKDSYYATGGLAAWVEALTSVPFPECHWIIPQMRSPQSLGGDARAAALSPARRSEIARDAATRRWAIGPEPSPKD